MELNKIYNENCLDLMSRMPDDFVDLVVTSPPYDGLRTYNGFSFDFENVAKELYRILKPGGVIVWIVGDGTIEGSETLTSFKQAIFFNSLGLNMHDTMIYQKNSLTFPETTRYYPCFEYMFVLSKGKPKTINLIADRKNKNPGATGGTFRQKDGELKKGYGNLIKDVGIRFNIWSFDTGFGKSSADEISFEHPASFPEKLARDHIYSWSKEGDLVYEPFTGSGTTLKMAHLQKRNWIGSEISAEYCAVAEKRIAPYLNQTTLNL